MVDLIFLFFWIRIFSNSTDHPAVIEDVPTLILHETIIERRDDGVDEGAEVLVEVDAIEIVVDILEGSEGDGGEVFKVMLVVDFWAVEENVIDIFLRVG